jgi:PPOX class probable F420-dependent enzyme
MAMAAPPCRGSALRGHSALAAPRTPVAGKHVDRRGPITDNAALNDPGRDPDLEEAPMPTHAPLAPQIEQFIHDNPQGVLTSFRRNGMPQLSIVTVYPRDGGVGISITENRMKFKNLLRDPRCSVLISHADWWSGFLVFEGKAELTHSGNTDPEALRLARRHIYSATTRRRSRDWAEYDRITEADKRVAMVLRPDHVYGSALAKMREALAK